MPQRFLLARGETDLQVLIQGHVSFNMPPEAERGDVCSHCTVKPFIHPGLVVEKSFAM